MNNLTYEFLVMTRKDLPISIRKVQKDEFAEGCMFHWHKEIEFYYVKSGGVKLLYNGKYELISENKVALVNAYAPHKSLGFLPETEHYVIQINLENKALSGIEPIFYTWDFIDGIELDRYFERLLEEYSKVSIESKYRCIGIIYELFAKLYEKSSENKLPLYNHHQLDICLKVLEYIHENYMKQISVNILANHVNVTVEHLCRIFKKWTGVTMITYINTVRCTSAIVLLEEGIPVATVAELVGFTDYNYFSRIFKKLIGYVPSKVNKE